MANGSKQADGGGLAEPSSDGELVDADSESPEADGGEPSASPNFAMVDEEDGGEAAGLEEDTADAAVDDEGRPLDEDGEPVDESLETRLDTGDEPLEDERRDVGDRVGETLAGRYELVEFIERGAMGEVYEAEHALMKKRVAVKILHSEVTGQGKIVERFRREAQAAANIDHPNVCIATDFGRTGTGEFFLVMEFLQGEPLKDVIDRQGRFETDRALHIAHQIASALARAHEVGVVHRDLKPDNIMLVERGDDSDFVKILDFGIARVRMEDQTPELTKTGAVFGTPSYMSPEQAAGDPLDHRADLYAMGNVMFEMLTGRRVFEADRGAQVMAMHVSKDPPSPSETVDGAIDEEVESLILSLLDKEPGERPQSADILREKLEDLGADRDRPLPSEEPFEVGTEETLEPPPAAATQMRDDEQEGDDASRVLPRTLDTTSIWLKRQGTTARWAALGLLGVGALMAATLLFTVAAGDEATSGVAEARGLFLDRDETADLRRAFKRGAYATALRHIETLRSQKGIDSPHLTYLEGRAHAERDEWSSSLDSFQRSLEREPSYIRDHQLLESMLDALGAADGDVAERTRGLLEPHLDRENVVQTLGRAAWRDGSSRTRQQARKLLDNQGLLDDLPDWVQASIRLRHSHGCEEHDKQIDELVELGDPRGLEVLHLYDKFPTRGCGEDDSEDCFGCIRDDIDQAMQTLRRELDTRKAAPPAASSESDAGG